ncbi:MAG: DUF3160 domain-containing protein [Clostridiales bacterium]|nr:DUF3160 domain-containing protein [Clostridiales bacterium]
MREIFCSRCGTQLEEGTKFCPVCGAPTEEENTGMQWQQNSPVPGKRKRGLLAALGITAGCLAVALVTVVVLNIADNLKNKNEDSSYTQALEEESTSSQEKQEGKIQKVAALERPSILGIFEKLTDDSLKPNVGSYTVDADLGNVTNREQFIHDVNSEQAQLLAENMFYVTSGYQKEFFETYESNRYALVPNFVTVDSMMHTYHLYFSYLMKKTERNYIADALSSVSRDMLAESAEQYKELKGTEWESAALRNMAFFAVGAYLQDESTEIPEEVSEIASREISKIMDASEIGDSELTRTMLDYSQFLPRGYYEGDEQLEKYFRAMMWYGQVGFLRTDEDLERSALLMTLAMGQDAFSQWEAIYVVTSFFAGASDDLTYYEYLPAIEAAYGKAPKMSSLVGNEEGWKRFRLLTEEMKAPAINSIPTVDDNNPDTKTTEQNKGFRFMGQRFTIDAAIFKKLIYEEVQKNPSGDKRMLPDVLDVASALGSDAAYAILEEQGDTAYANYKENMEGLRAGIANAPETLWSASLYSNWLYTLKPLLEEKGEGYPSFMRSAQWAKKNLESFAGSYTELKHDTVLYAKQVMAEMGGGELPKWDDRGYVEPEIEVWSRFAQLSAKTAEGLKSYGILSEEDADNLKRLEEMAEQFLVMSQKELSNTLLTDEEYDLIRNYGGNLEHFWLEAFQDEGENINSGDFPAAIVTDIATDPNGTCLEVGTGNPSIIYVIVPIDGELHICSGAVFSFYQFEQPISDRLTDSAWRQMMGIAATDEGLYSYDTAIDQPKWTRSYRYEYK